MFRRLADVELTWDVRIEDVPIESALSWNRTPYDHNRFYAPIGVVSPQIIRKMAALEAELIDDLESIKSGDESGSDEFDEIAGIEAEEEFLLRLPHKTPPLDLGVGAAVLALAAFGCRTISSCNASAFSYGHQEDYPLIAFYCTRPILEALEPILRQFAVGLSWSSDTLMLYTRDVREFVYLADELTSQLEKNDQLYG